MRTALAVLVALALASPSWAQDFSKPSKHTVERCWDDATYFPEGGKQPRDPFEDVALFTCMLRGGYQFCRDCQSSWRGKCGRNRWAPHDPKCWESKTFPEVRSIVE